METPPTDTPPLRIVLLCSAGHAGSAIVFNLLSHCPDVQIVGILRSPPVKGGSAAMRKHFKNLGWRFSWMLAWQRIIQLIAYAFAIALEPFTGRRHFYLPVRWQARRGRIPLLSTDNVNGKAALAFLRECKPDLVVSAFYNRILKAEAIKVPRLGTINIHPGGLPGYKGAMSYFWVLRNNEAQGGVTLHWIDEGIDTGDIVYRRAFTVRPNTTQHQMLLKTAVAGGWLARRAAFRLRRGLSLPAIPQEPHAQGAYYPMPGEKDFDAYSRTRRFFRLRDVFTAVLRAASRLKPPRRR